MSNLKTTEEKLSPQSRGTLLQTLSGMQTIKIQENSHAVVTAASSQKSFGEVDDLPNRGK